MIPFHQVRLRRLLLASILYTLMTTAVLYPILIVRIPGLGDYLNHLARMHILSNIGHSAALAQFYRVHWQAIPYLAMDATFFVLKRVAPIYDAGRIFVGICVILPVLSVALLHLAVHRRLSLVPLAAFLLCYNNLLSWGFLNYLVTCCLAVIVFTGWVASVGWSRWPRVILFSVLTLGVYLGHLVAFGAYCLMVGAFEIQRAWRAGFQPWRSIASDWLAAGLQVLPAMMAALSVGVEGPYIGSGLTVYGTLSQKIVAMRSPVLFWGGRVDLAILLFAGTLFLFCLVTRRLRLAPSIWPVALAVGTLSIFVPIVLLGTFGMDLRLPLVAAVLLLGAISTTERLGPIMRLAVLSGVVVLVGARSVSIAASMQTADRQIAQVRNVVASMPRGVRLLLVFSTNPPSPMNTMVHVGMVAVIDRDAFVPTLFTGLTIVKLAPDFLASQGDSLNMSDLADGLGRDRNDMISADDGHGNRVYWMGWENKFDYVLIFHFGARPQSLPWNLRLVAASSIADLYQIDRTVAP